MKNDKRTYLFGNWKMNMDKTKIDHFFTICRDRMLSGSVSGDIVMAIFVPFVYLDRVVQTVRAFGLADKISIGVQNVHPEDRGAFTGETSIPMAVECGATFSILGHSERRHIFKEDNTFIGDKVRACLKKAIKPVLCVGETLEEREDKKTWSVIENQLEKCLDGIDNPRGLIVAYEPVWAIGTGLSASSEDAQNVCKMIRVWLNDRFTDYPGRIPVLYGGSVKPSNSRELLSMQDIDGGLIGGASMDAGSFIDMLEITGNM